MEQCICGHLKKEHELNNWKVFGLKPTYYEECYLINACYHLSNGDTDCYCRQFKLDNLQLIAELAVKRGLV